MKRQLFFLSVILTLLVCFTGAANAEVQWQLGFKGGVNLGKLSGDTQYEDGFDEPGVGFIEFSGDVDGFRPGFMGGGFVTANASPKFGVRAELLYVQKGGKGDLDVTVDGSPFGGAELRFEFDYIEIPILAVGSYPMGERAALNLFAGPTIAFTTKADFVIELEGQEESEDVSEFVKGTDFGLAFGAGVDIAASETVHVILDGRWTQGLSQIPDDGDGDLKNGSLSFLGGLSFPLSP